jgi:hypothetical protein
MFTRREKIVLLILLLASPLFFLVDQANQTLRSVNG